ncbi:MAG: class I SAM-dependent methyltransferase [Candidatus Binatia bacterium]
MAEAAETAYAGRELDLFALANNWKSYIKEEIARYISGDVLEVGAGIGATTAALHDGTARCWVCLEPDASLASRLQSRILDSAAASTTKVIVGSLGNFAQQARFDCILYIDVLEHIEDDRGQIERAAQLVRSGGRIIVLSPAHQWLFSDFDKSIGHFRRYKKATLRSLMPSGWVEEKLTYLDSIGVLLSLGNVLALRQAMPKRSQIILWDRLCVPLSRHVDHLSGGVMGKSVLAVWRKGRRIEE